MYVCTNCESQHTDPKVAANCCALAKHKTRSDFHVGDWVKHWTSPDELREVTGFAGNKVELSGTPISWYDMRQYTIVARMVGAPVKTNRSDPSTHERLVERVAELESENRELLVENAQLRREKERRDKSK